MNESSDAVTEPETVSSISTQTPLSIESSVVEYNSDDDNEDETNFNSKKEKKKKGFAIKISYIAPLTLIILLFFYGIVVLAHKLTPLNDENSNLNSIEDSQTDSLSQFEAESMLPSTISSQAPTNVFSQLPSKTPSMTPSSLHSTYPSINPTKLELITLVSTLTSTDDSFGFTLALSDFGEHLAVGAPIDKNGHVSLYRAKITNNDAVEWETYGHVNENPSMTKFGYNVQLSGSGTKLCVLAVHRGFFVGGVYVVVYDYGGMSNLPWTPSYFWKEDGYDITKTTVAFSGDGDIFSIGSDNLFTGGRLLIFSDNQAHYLGLGNENTMGEDSVSFSKSGDRLAYHAGHKVYVFQYYDEIDSYEKKWVQIGKSIPDSYIRSDDDEFGSSVVLSSDGNFVVVASKIVAKVYNWNSVDNDWHDFGNIITDEYNILPSTLCASFYSSEGEDGEKVYKVAMASVPEQRLFIASNVVRVFQYRFSNKTWFRVHTISGKEYPGFGASLSMSEDGTRIAVGAPSMLRNDHQSEPSQVLIYDMT